jgi:hypothetical protein
MSQFDHFSKAVKKQFETMCDGQLFVTDTDRDGIWDVYLKSFPDGTNPMFRKRTEHDCSCCRAFIRTMGNVVAIQNGTLTSIWDVSGIPAHYQAVADSMSEYVKSRPIRDVFLTKQPKHGTEQNHEHNDAGLLTWKHFSLLIPQKYQASRDIDEKLGDFRTNFQVLKRGFTELTPEAVETVAGLIADNSIYRGQEHAAAVTEFQRLQQRFLASPEVGRDVLCWSLVNSFVTRFRNTVIGTLVQDLSSGVDIERAVKSYEIKVAPANYKRSTSLITKSMVDAAMKTIRELGVEHALERRHAKFFDVSVNSVLFVDRAVRGMMKDGGIESLLMEETRGDTFDSKKTTEIGVDEFMKKVLPQTKSLDLWLDNSMLSNFVSMTAPVHENSGELFKWANDFAWSYDGNVTDSIREKVKRAGGRVEGNALRVSLAWSNHDDLDLHVKEPSGFNIFFGAKINRTGTGALDVDMNAGFGKTRTPVENTRFSKVSDGNYEVSVHNYARRESRDVGFTVEIEVDNQIHTLSHPSALPDQRKIKVATVKFKGGRATVVPAEGITMGSQPQEKWGVKTLELVKVNSVVLSPNHWDDQAIGNKHWFFILEGCQNPLPVRGIYNEFLHSKFDKHRKVFEILGEKTKCQPTPEQMSGVGFSSTISAKVPVRAMGPKLRKSYTIVL